MLQRQIMLKQMQELQRRQQIQELNDARNQAYVNQLSSGGHFSPTVNGTPVHESSQMFMLGNMQMMQHGGSNAVQGLPNGFVLQQSHHNSGGPLGQQQFGVSSYGAPASNIDKNLNQYSHLQAPSHGSGNLLGKNNNNFLAMSSMQPSTFGNSFMRQQSNLSSNQIGMQDGSTLPGQGFQEKNFFGQVPVKSSGSEYLSGSYSEQGISGQRNASLLESEGRQDEAAWQGDSKRKISKHGFSEPDASLDPLEQKILYNTDDNSWESPFSRIGKIGSGGFGNTVEHTSCIDELQSVQSGSWSALMQSAVAETSSSDTGIQEEWSGLSFQNPEPSIDNQPSTFINSENPQNNWVDKKFLNVSSSDTKPEQLLQNSNTSSMFPGFSQPGHQQKLAPIHLHSESYHTQQSPRSMSLSNDYNSQQKHSVGGSQLIQTSLPSQSIWPGQQNQSLYENDNQPHNYFSGHESRGTRWLHESSSHQVAGGSQEQYDQANNLNVHGYPTESDKMAANNIQQMPTLFGASSEFNGQQGTPQSENMLELFNRDDMSNDHKSGVQLNLKVSTPSELPLTDSSVASMAKPSNTLLPGGFSFTSGSTDTQTPAPYSFFPSLSMGNSSTASPSSHNANDYTRHQGPASSLPGQRAHRFPAHNVAASVENSQSKTMNSSGPEFPIFNNASVTQHSMNAIVPQHVGFSIGLPTPWSDTKNHHDSSSPKPNKFPNLFNSPETETKTGAPHEQPNQNSYKHEHNVHQFGTYSEQSEHSEKLLEKGSSLHESSTEMNSTLLSGTIHNKQESSRHNSEANAIASGSLVNIMHQKLPNQVEQRHNEAVSYPARAIGPHGYPSSQNNSVLHQVHSAINSENEGDKPLQLKYDGVNHQHVIANARELLLSGQKLGVNDKAKIDLDAARNKGWNFTQEVTGDQSGAASSMAYHQNIQIMDMFGQNNTQNRSIGSTVASNATDQSQISLQMAPSWFKHYGNSNNMQMVPTYNSKAAANAAQSFSGIAQGNLQENSMIMQVSSVTCQGSSVWPSVAVPSAANKHLVSPSMLPSDVSCQNLVLSMPKKRKMVEFDMVPWYKEVDSEPSRLQIISMAELQWAEVSNRRPEEVRNEAEMTEDVPVVRAKRRLIFTTQLMQQVFRPPPAVILSADSSLHCDIVAHSAARLALGDACSLSGLLLPNTNKGSNDELKTANKTKGKFSKVAEILVSRVKKFEDDLSRMEKSLSVVDIKAEGYELEKFSMINRFAKYHIKAQPSSADPASSSVMQRMNPQRYVIALPMPRTVPEGANCLSL